MRLGVLLQTLNISENRFKAARENLERAGLLRTVLGKGRGNYSLFFLPSCRLVEDENAWYNVFSEQEKAPQNTVENPSQKALQNPSQNPLVKGSVKGSVKPFTKGSVKDPVKPTVKGLENNPFYEDLNEGFSEDFSPTPFSPETASNQESNEVEQKNNASKKAPKNSKNIGQISAPPFKEGEGEGEKEGITSTSSLSLAQHNSHSPSRASLPSQPASLEELLAYAEEQRGMAGLMGATAAVAYKFWSHYSSTSPPWHTSPPGSATPNPLKDWRKKFRDWAVEERGKTDNSAVYSFDVNDIPSRLHNYSDFHDRWVDYLNECIRLNAPHSRTSAISQLTFLAERAQAGDNAVQILTTAIRNQTSKLYDEQRTTTRNGSRNRTNTGQNGSSSIGSTTARKPSQRKPQPEPNTKEESITIS
jgi:hypothetical protein